MKFAIVSVPHTGTNSINNILLQKDTEAVDMNLSKETGIRTQHNYFLSHYEQCEQEGRIIVSPMRHPIDTVNSWQKWRRAAIAEDPERYINNDWIKPHWVSKCFANMIWADDLFDVNYLPIDSPRSQEYLDKFNQKYNLNLKADFNKKWNTVGDVKEAKAPEEDVLAVEKVLRDNKEFFNRFYN